MNITGANTGTVAGQAEDVMEKRSHINSEYRIQKERFNKEYQVRLKRYRQAQGNQERKMKDGREQA